MNNLSKNPRLSIEIPEDPPSFIEMPSESVVIHLNRHARKRSSVNMTLHGNEDVLVVERVDRVACCVIL